ncbi:helix-turn-helix transcriptional regulator [Brachybacterium saurashtrense]|uniref:helix-turn-helix transcriptional regulator n=1 Tax=Brachybacterium saurashtrense TaxID=556288 RepID=UPI0026B19EC4
MCTRENRFLTTKQLSERWQTPVATLGNWRYLNEGPPCLKVGNSVRYSLQAIEEFEEKHTVKADNSRRRW